MFKYEYLDAVREDVSQYIRDNIDLAKYDTLDELEDALNSDLWTEDSVTGNASGSYTFNAFKAEEYIAHNWDLLREAIEGFGIDENPIDRGAEWCDVTIRCYLLAFAISEALEEIEDEFNTAHEDESEEEED